MKAHLQKLEWKLFGMFGFQGFLMLLWELAKYAAPRFALMALIVCAAAGPAISQWMHK